MTDLPPGWAEVTVKDVTTIQLGRQRSPKDHTGPHMRPYLRAANVGWGGLRLDDVKEMNFDPDEAATYELEAGDILLNEASGSPNEVGKPAIYGGEVPGACFQNTLLRVKSDGPLRSYLYWYFMHTAMAGAFGEAGRGVNIRHLGKRGLSDFGIPLPPIAEQHRIVNAIEEQVTRIDAASQVLTEARSRLAFLRFLVLDAAFSLGPVEMRPLDELRDPDRPICYGILKPRTEGDLQVPYVEVRTIKEGRVVLDDVPKTTRALHEEYKRSELRTGDVLMAVRGSWDRAAVVPPELDGGNVSRDVARITPAEGMDERDLAHYWVSGAAKQFFAQHARGVGVQGVNIGDLRQLPVPVVSIERQRALADDLDARVSALSVMADDLERGSRRAALLKSAVLSAAFSGRLVLQDPNDEPAQMLLDRIAEERHAQMPTANKVRGRVAS